MSQIYAMALICYPIDVAGYGKLAGQMLMLFANGLVFSFTKDRKERRKLVDEGQEIWRNIDQRTLNQLLKRFYLQGYLEKAVRKDKDVFKISSRGKLRALQYKFDELTLPSLAKWDGTWRIVLFDIPEPQKRIRDSLRRKLKEIGFLEFQKSVFVYPFHCRDEINFIINFYGINDFIHYLEAPIVFDARLRKHFKM